MGWYISLSFFFCSDFINLSNHLKMLLARHSLHNWCSNHFPVQRNQYIHTFNGRCPSAVQQKPETSRRETRMSVRRKLWQTWNRCAFSDRSCCKISLSFGVITKSTALKNKLCLQLLYWCCGKALIDYASEICHCKHNFHKLQKEKDC